MSHNARRWSDVSACPCAATKAAPCARTMPATPKRGSSTYVCIDDHSRLSSVEVLYDEKSKTAADFLKRALRWFRRTASPPVASSATTAVATAVLAFVVSVSKGEYAKSSPSPTRRGPTAKQSDSSRPCVRMGLLNSRCGHPARRPPKRSAPPRTVFLSPKGTIAGSVHPISTLPNGRVIVTGGPWVGILHRPATSTATA